MNSKGCVVNIDSDLLWYMYESNKANVENFEDVLKAYMDGYSNQDISDLIFCCFCQQSIIPSKVWDWFGDKYNQKVENGVAVDYTNNNRIKHVVDIYNAMQRDPYDILIEEARKRGMAAWLSVRMNDCHCHHEQTNFLHGSMYYEALKNGWFIGKEAVPYTWAECYDYSVDFVRNKMLAYIFELLDNHDMDGLELDFQREIYCFDYIKNPECYKIMTDFMQQVRAYARKKEAENGHKIQIGVRLCRNIEDNKTFGFDIVEWVKQDLVDVVVVTSRWENTDSEMPITEWKKLLDGTGIKLWAGLEANVFVPYGNTEETLKGFSVQYLDAGADQMYLYNYYRTRARQEELSYDELVNKSFEWWLITDHREQYIRKAWKACSNIEEAKKGIRRNVMTFQEEWMAPKGLAYFKPFPVQVNEEKCFTMQTGSCGSKKATFFVGLGKGSQIPEIMIDGKPAIYMGEAKNSFMDAPMFTGVGMSWMIGYSATKGAQYYAYEFIPGDGNVREIVVKGNCELRYFEIKVEGD